jgi:sulfur-carrier protein
MPAEDPTQPTTASADRTAERVRAAGTARAEGTATVRLFAALRDAAGTGSVEVGAPAPLQQVLAEVRSGFDERFARRLELAAVMVDGEPVDRHGDALVPAGAEVALLPPFAGG